MRLVGGKGLGGNADEVRLVVAGVMANANLRLACKCGQSQRGQQRANGEDEAGAERASTKQ